MDEEQNIRYHLLCKEMESCMGHAVFIRNKQKHRHSNPYFVRSKTAEAVSNEIIRVLKKVTGNIEEIRNELNQFPGLSEADTPII